MRQYEKSFEMNFGSWPDFLVSQVDMNLFKKESVADFFLFLLPPLSP